MNKMIKYFVFLILYMGVVTAQQSQSLVTIGGTGSAATSAHITVTAAGDNKAYLCPDEFSVLGEATITTWGYDATCGSLPMSPMNLVAIAGDELVTLTWDDNPEADVSNYHIARATDTGVNKTYLVGLNGNVTKYVDKDVVNKQMYYYVIWASDNYQNASEKSNEVAAMPQDLGIPSTPENFACESGDGELTLTWDDCPEVDVAAYNLFRGAEMGEPMVHIAGVGGNVTSYVDVGLVNGETYYYKIAASDEASNTSPLSDYVSGTPETLLGVDDVQQLPEAYALEPNYPNPFNPTTTIRYNLPEAAQVRIMIYDMLGREVRSLVNGYVQAGYQSIMWDATDNGGRPVSGGVYIYSIQSDRFNANRKMILLK
ncbi:FlgD immunoglobulin-like domain containing protein [Candidatus Neomarinimicrobiota bacterium]